jgi:hypothetical protein
MRFDTFFHGLLRKKVIRGEPWSKLISKHTNMNFSRPPGQFVQIRLNFHTLLKPPYRKEH